MHLVSSNAATDIDSAIAQFTATHGVAIKWQPIGGRNNNSGTIEASGDPGRALVERVTNAVDAVLEAEHASHDGRPECRTPRDAATAWLNVPDNGLSDLTTRQRQQLANRIVVKLQPGTDRDARTLEVRDHGIGSETRSDARHHSQSQRGQQASKAVPRGTVWTRWISDLCLVSLHGDRQPIQ